MGEIPADWLEKSAAIAARKAGNGNVPASKPKEVQGPINLTGWIRFDERKDIKIGEEYLAIMKSSGVRGYVIRGITLRPDFTWRYNNGTRADVGDILWLCRVNFNLPKECGT